MTLARQRPSIYSQTFSQIENALVEGGVRAAHALALWRSLYRAQERPIPLPPPLEQWLAGTTFSLSMPALAKEVASADAHTRKLLLRLDDGETIETVLMNFRGRTTVCLSTQAGCAMGCIFCATGQAGFARHLEPGEMVAQVLLARRTLLAHGEAPPRNVVLMGMGEPLHNYDGVMTALEIITDTRGLNIGPSRITISTVGVVPGILRLADECRPYHLAVSLHGATEEARAALVPISRRWTLAELIAACRQYAGMTRRRIFFEWTLIAGKNDGPADAARLAEMLAGIDSHVNLIPLNPTEAYSGAASTRSTAAEFQRVLAAAGIPSTVRQRRGIDVAAGCGQLGMTNDETPSVFRGQKCMTRSKE